MIDPFMKIFPNEYNPLVQVIFTGPTETCCVAGQFSLTRGLYISQLRRTMSASSILEIVSKPIMHGSMELSHRATDSQAARLKSRRCHWSHESGRSRSPPQRQCPGSKFRTHLNVKSSVERRQAQARGVGLVEHKCSRILARATV